MKANLRKAAITRKASLATQAAPGPQTMSEVQSELLNRLAHDHQASNIIFMLDASEMVRLLEEIRTDIDIVEEEFGAPNTTRKQRVISYLMKLFFRIEELSNQRCNHDQSGPTHLSIAV